MYHQKINYIQKKQTLQWVNQGILHSSEAATGGVLYKKVFLIISQNSQENTCTRVFFNKNATLGPETLLKKRLWYRCFPVNFVKFLRTLFLQNTSERLFLTALRWKHLQQWLTTKSRYLLWQSSPFLMILRDLGNASVLFANLRASYPAGIYLLKFNNRNTRTRCKICSKLTIKTPERRLASFWCLYW